MFVSEWLENVKLNVGNLVMLKTAPRFRLDRSYKGPFRIKSLTSTNVSRQRLSLCKAEMSNATPWARHSGRLRKRRQVRCNSKINNLEVTDQNDQKNMEVTEQNNIAKFSRFGRPIKKPARFLHVSSPEDHSQKEGEVVRLQETGSCETNHVRNTLQKTNVAS